MTLRERFEQWYVENAFDYVRDPIGSRECGLQWASYQAAYRLALEDAERQCKHLRDERDADVHTCAAAIRALAEGI